MARAVAHEVPELVDDAASSVGAGWRVVGLPRQKPPMTQYGAARVDGRAALRIEAVASYGNLVHEPNVPAAWRTLRWSWRLERGNPLADLLRKPGDDVPLRVCLSFELPIERVPFVERQLLRLARRLSGEELPAATLCWVWDHKLPAGTLLGNAYSRRVRMIVLRSGAADLHRWVDEAVDVAGDFKRAFGDESAELPPIRAVIVAADGDNTGAASLGYVAGLRGESP